MTPHTAAVVVSHDTTVELLRCLDSLAGTGVDAIVVVDSGSRQPVAPTVTRRFPHAVVVALPNVGFGRAVNAGVARTSATVVIVANADVRFAPDSVRTLAAALVADGDLAAVGPLVRYPDGRPQASARRQPDLTTAVAHAVLGLWWPTNPWTRRYRLADHDPSLPVDVDWLSGCALALRRGAFDDVGGFDPAYFMYVEDADLCWRLRRAGWRLRTCPAAQVVHDVGASTSQRPAAMVASHARSLDRFYARAYSGRAARALRPAVRVGLVAWAVSSILWRRTVGRRTGRASTGE